MDDAHLFSGRGGSAIGLGRDCAARQRHAAEAGWLAAFCADGVMGHAACAGYLFDEPAPADLYRPVCDLDCPGADDVARDRRDSGTALLALDWFRRGRALAALCDRVLAGRGLAAEDTANQI